MLGRLQVPFDKIAAITLHNATNNDTLFDFLEHHGIAADSHQVRYMAHIINLAVQDILGTLKIPDVYANPNVEHSEDLSNEVRSKLSGLKENFVIDRFFFIL